MKRRDFDSPRWWREDAEAVHTAVFAVARHLESEQEPRRQENDLLRRLYGAKMPSTSLHGVAAPVLGPEGKSCWTYNLVRTAVQVLGAKVAKSKPKASFVTTGGDWAAQRRARGLDKYVYGVMHAADCYKTLRRVFRDAAVCDLGVLMGWVDNGKVCLERVDPDEIRVDVADGYNGRPRTLLRSYVVSRDTAHGWVEAWNKGRSLEVRERMHQDVAAAATGMDDRDRGARAAAFGDVVQVHEAWHLPSSPEAKDGRHVLALSTVALLDETKDEAPDFFPFAFCRLEEPFQGFYGQGVAQALVGQQRAINLTLRRISSIVDNAAVLYLHLDNSTKLAQEQGVSGEGVRVFRGTNPPQQVVGNPVPPALWQMADYAIQRGLESVGLNENAPAAEKPAGLNSGVALREYEDIQSDRLSTYHLAFEECVVDVARLVVRLSKQAADNQQSLTAFFPRGQRSEEVRWSKVQADEESFVLQCYSTSSLPATPAARKQYVEELWESGQIDSAEYRRLLEIPDIEASDNLALAARDVVDRALDRMLDGDDDGDEDSYTPAEPFDDLAYALKRSTLVYSKARLDGAPEGRLDMVRQYILQVTAMLQQAASAAPPAPVGNLRAPDAATPSAVPATPAAPPMAA